MTLDKYKYWERDGNVIYCGDCREILPLLPDKSVDLVLTDPPYDFESAGGGFYGNWHGNGHEPRKYMAALADANCVTFNPIETLNLLKAKMTLFYGYFFCNKNLVDQYITIARSERWAFDILAMGKHNPIPACSNHHLHDLEYVVMMRAKGTRYFKSPHFDDNRKLFMTTCDGENLHPAEKPVGFLCRMINVSSTTDNCILDPFMGSGTTLVAAKKLGRKFIGIEISEAYCALAVKRLAQEVMLFPETGVAKIEREA